MISNSNIITNSAGFEEIEAKLKIDYVANHFFWMGRAATALLYVYSAIRKLRYDIEDPEIILPALSCATPSNTALMCGLKVRYADISEKDALINLEEIKKRVTSKTVAVLFIHLYGNTADLLSIKKYCEEKNIFLIEDVAQSLGGYLPNGDLSGSVGDFTVFSFNKTKILECGGGALAVKNASNSEVIKDIIANHYFRENKDCNYLSELSMSYRNLHHSLVSLKRTNAVFNISEGFLNLRKNYEDLFFKSAFDKNAFANDYVNLGDKLKSRKEKAAIYSNAISRLKTISTFNGWELSGCCWRFSFLIGEPQFLVKFSDAIRKPGFHASNLYWPVNQFFNPADECPVADKVGRSIINLWVDDSVSKDWVKKCSDSIIKFLTY